MITLKTPAQIKLMAECGKRLKRVTDVLMTDIKPGMTTMDLERKARKLFEKEKLGLSFPTVEGYKWALCTPVNAQAVHTPPSDYVLRNGDVLTIDTGGLYEGYHTDWATTIIVGNDTDNEKLRFVEAGKAALDTVLTHLHLGMNIGEIGALFEDLIEGKGYRVMRDLTGHGIGRALHEDPYIFNFRPKHIEKTYAMEPGFTAAIEIIYAQSTGNIKQYRDAWTIDTADGSLAACFEHTVAFDAHGVYILT